MFLVEVEFYNLGQILVYLDIKIIVLGSWKAFHTLLQTPKDRASSKASRSKSVESTK